MKYLILPITALAVCACNPVDRSSEQPLAPTVATAAATVVADSAELRGEILTSPNSDVTECGFTYGNDTLRVTLKAENVATVFTAVTDSLGAGDYYAVAYARNGVGTGYGDTIRFTIGQ